MMAQGNRCRVIDRFVRLLPPRVNSTGGLHYPQNEPIYGHPAYPKDYQRREGLFSTQ